MDMSSDCKGQPKRDSGIIFGSCKASQVSGLSNKGFAILAVSDHVSCPSLSSSGPREWGESALKTKPTPWSALPLGKIVQSVVPSLSLARRAPSTGRYDGQHSLEQPSRNRHLG